MKRRLCSLLLSLAAITPSLAEGPVDRTYVRSLAAPGKTVLVVEYYDGSGKVIDRKGFASRQGYRAVSPTDFAVTDALAIHLFGIEPCSGDLVNRRENFAGSCAAYAEQGLAIMLKSPKVIYCRAFVSEAEAPIQDATCYGYYNYPGVLDSIDMLETQLVSVGTHRVAKNSDGSLVRPDLKEAQEIGKAGGYGMWADARIKAQ